MSRFSAPTNHRWSSQTDPSTDDLNENLLEDEYDPEPPAPETDTKPPLLKLDLKPTARNEPLINHFTTGPSRERYSPPPRTGGATPRLIIAIDYGTTFTGIAYAQSTSKVANLADIKVLLDWGRKMDNQLEVPSRISFSQAKNGERQWGSEISEGSITHINTKLELEVQDKRGDELELTSEALEEVGNLTLSFVKSSGKILDPPSRSPNEIVANYLKKICEHALPQIKSACTYDERKQPIDVVITVPVKWSYQARNATFRAIREAGINKEVLPTLENMILVNEPAAASHFVVRDLQARGSRILKLNEPFILVDAGGGTVDVICYQVKRIEPQLEIVEVSEPTSKKCGAAYIDTNFKRWLRKVLGSENYREIDPTTSRQRSGMHTSESGLIGQLIRDFDDRKRVFSKEQGAFALDLPIPLNTLSINGVVEKGQITIRPTDMQSVFTPCVNKVVQLVKDQREVTERKIERRVKNVFLVGGFGESPYLRQQLQQSVEARELKLHPAQHETSITAVVQGAVVYGIEKDRQTDLKLMLMSKRSYGIVVDDTASSLFDDVDWETDPLTDMAMVRNQFVWMVRKDDLILSNEPLLVEKDFVRTFKTGEDLSFDLYIYKYPDPDDDVPSRWANGKHDVERVGAVRCYLSHLRQSLQRRRNYKNMVEYFLGYFKCKMQVSSTAIQVGVYLNTAQVGSTSISIKDEETQSLADSERSWD